MYEVAGSDFVADFSPSLYDQATLGVDQAAVQPKHQDQTWTLSFEGPTDVRGTKPGQPEQSGDEHQHQYSAYTLIINTSSPSAGDKPIQQPDFRYQDQILTGVIDQQQPNTIRLT